MAIFIFPNVTRINSFKKDGLVFPPSSITTETLSGGRVVKIRSKAKTNSVPAVL